jgi:L-threonylcarbamoyladenylate synthase
VANRPGESIGDQIDAAVVALAAGSVVAFPTETFYGLGADPRSPSALRRVLRIKGRGEGDKPLLLLVSSIDQLAPWVGDLPRDFDRLAARFWPGPLTLVLPAAPALPPSLVGPGGGVAMRITSHPLARRLIDAWGGALTGTSANRSGAPPAADAVAVGTALGPLLGAIVDGGSTPGGQPSSLLDLCGPTPRLLREGAVTAAALRRVVRLV